MVLGLGKRFETLPCQHRLLSAGPRARPGPEPVAVGAVALVSRSHSQLI